MQKVKSNSRFASVVDLGQLLSQHPVNKRNRWGSLIFGLICLLVAPLLFALTSYYYDLSNNTDSPVFVSVDPREIYWPAIFGAVLLLVGLWLLFNTARNWNTVASVHEHGLVLRDHSGLRPIRWDAITDVWQSITRHYRNGIYTHTGYVYSILTKDGKKLKFDNKFTTIEQLGNTIQENVSEILLPGYMHALNNGQLLSFGPLSVDLLGLYSGDKSLPWHEITALKINSGIIAIQKDGSWSNWAPISVAHVPNLLVFHQIANWLTRTTKTAWCPI